VSQGHGNEPKVYLERGVGRGKVTWPNKWNSLFVTIKCIKVLPCKLYYFENAEFYFFQRPNFDDETVLIINKPKYPKKGVYKEQNGRTHIQEVKKEPPKRANHKGNISSMFLNPLLSQEAYGSMLGISTHVRQIIN